MTKNLLINIALLFCMGLLVFGGITQSCSNAKLEDANAKLNKELMQSNLELGRAHTQFGDVEAQRNQLKAEIQDEIKERNGLLTRYGELQAKYRREKKNNLGKTTVITRDVEIKVVRNDLVRGVYYLALSPSILTPIDGFETNYKDDKLWLEGKIDTTVFPEEWKFNYVYTTKLELQLSEVHLPSGAVNHYATLYELNPDGTRDLEMEIEKFAMIIEMPSEKQMFWWAPHIDIGGLVGVAGTPAPEVLLGGSLGFSFSGYGRTLNDLDWRFFRLSLDLANETVGPGFTPVVYNVGQWLPLFSNLWIGPHVNYLPPEGWGAGLYIGAML